MSRENDDLVTPQWLVVARRNRRRFIFSLLTVFAILTVLAWWGLPRLSQLAAEVAQQGGGAPLPAHVKIIAWLGSWFRIFWVMIAIGCAAALVIALTGKIDTLLPLLSGILLVAGFAAVGFTIYVFYLPTLSLLRR